MALKEGRCPNCGSILSLDTVAEKGHCLFCDAVFDNKTAFEIAANPKGVVFPNLPQPKYEGPTLDPKLPGTLPGQLGKSKQSQPAIKKSTKPAPAVPMVQRQEVKIPDMRLSTKTKLIAFALTVAALLIIAALSVPGITARDTNRAKLVDEMSTIAPFAINITTDVAISRMDNSHLLIAADTAISEAEMISLFKNYCLKRAEIQGIPTSDFKQTYGQVIVKLVTPEGGFIISEPESQAELENGAALVKLS